MRTKTASLFAAAMTLAACLRGPKPRHDAGREASVHCACSAHAPLTPSAPTPETSLFHLDAAWTDQSARPFRLASLRGAPTVLLMFYGTCQSVCPVLISDVLRIEAALTPATRQRVRFVLVTFDPATDTSERLAALAAERNLERASWTLLRGSEDDTRALATVLGVQYSHVDATTITHSNTITLLDPQGVVAHQLEGLRQPVDDMAARIEAMAPR